MLKITTRAGLAETVLELEGKLAGSWVQVLENCYRHELRTGRPQKIVLKAVTFIDAPGRELLSRMHAGGAELAGEGCMTRAIIDEIYREGNHE